MSRQAAVAKAMAFIREHGVVLASAKGAAPRLTEAIVGEPLQGSWWAHPKSHHIFAVLQAVAESDQVLVCRLVNGKITLVHRRLWPSLVRLARRFAPAQLARVEQQHTPSGRHANREVPFPQWVPPHISALAAALEEKAALVELAPWLSPSKVPSAKRNRDA